MSDLYYEDAYRIFRQVIAQADDEKIYYLRYVITNKPHTTKRIIKATFQIKKGSPSFHKGVKYMCKLLNKRDKCKDLYKLHLSDVFVIIKGLNEGCKSLCKDIGMNEDYISLLDVTKDKRLFQLFKKAIEPEVVCESKKLFPLLAERERILISDYKGELVWKFRLGVYTYKTSETTYGLFKEINEGPYDVPSKSVIRYMFLVKDGFETQMSAEFYLDSNLGEITCMSDKY